MAKKNETKDFVATQDELATQLGISKRTVARLTKLEGCPLKGEEGLYDVTEWLRFRKRYLEESSTLLSLPKETKEKLAQVRLRRDTATAEREELLLAKLKGELVNIDEVRAVWSGFYERMTGRLKNMLNSIPQLPVGEADRLFYQFLTELHQEEAEQAKLEPAIRTR